MKAQTKVKDSDTILAKIWYTYRLTESVTGGATDTYDYDPSGQRVKYITGGTTTYYPSKSYKVDSKGKAVKHLFAGGLMGTATIGRELLVSIVPLARPEGRYSTFL